MIKCITALSVFAFAAAFFFESGLVVGFYARGLGASPSTTAGALDDLSVSALYSNGRPSKDTLNAHLSTIDVSSTPRPQTTTESGNPDVYRSPVLRFGADLQPSYASPIDTLLWTTAGRNEASVVSSNGIEVGQKISSTSVPNDTRVISVVGDKLTMSEAATVTGSHQARFGVARMSAASTILANTIAASNLYAGAAATHGTWSWLARLSGGSDYPNVAPFMTLAPKGGVGSAYFAGSRLSDASQRPFPVANSFMWVDLNPHHWGASIDYKEGNLTSRDLGYYVNEESSIYSLWPYAITDPFAFNPLGGTRNLRLDCGKGLEYESMGTPRDCSAALEIIDNAARFGKGIMFSQNALTPRENDLGQAVVMAPNQALSWYYANNTPGWSIFMDKMTGAHGEQYSLHFSPNAASFRSNLYASGHIAQASAGPALTGCGTDAQLSPGSTDTDGWLTFGTGTGNLRCNIHFVHAYEHPPSCIVSPTNSSQTYMSYGRSATVLEIVARGGTFGYHCGGV